MISLRQIIACWNRFFFEPISPATIAVYRIVLGSVLLANFLLLVPDLEAWYSDKGTLSLETAKQVSGGTVKFGSEKFWNFQSGFPRKFWLGSPGELSYYGCRRQWKFNEKEGGGAGYSTLLSYSMFSLL